VILYEYPFNERIRTYLKLEHLFERLEILLKRNDPIDHHHAIQTIFEVMDVGSRSDMKSDVLKDIDRHKAQLNTYRGNPAISEQLLDDAIAKLDHSFHLLSSTPGKTGQGLLDIDWLMSLRGRMSIPGGTCEFDLPAYFDWQHHSVEQRRTDLLRWAATLTPLASAVGLLIKMLRDSGSAQKVVALGGQFQQNLPPGRTFQLLRLRINTTLGLIPEISGNRLMMSERQMRQGDDDRLHAAAEDAAFELTLCA
jgi:cell division protein ZapD